jgi:hypothetical protein
LITANWSLAPIQTLGPSTKRAMNCDSSSDVTVARYPVSLSRVRPSALAFAASHVMLRSLPTGFSAGFAFVLTNS